MRYFTLLDFQHWVVALSLGLLAVILIYVAWGLCPAAEEGEGRDGEYLSGGQNQGANPIPPILIFIVIGALLWAVGYAIIEGILGGAIG